MSDEKTQVTLEAYTINGYKAPDRCETCNDSLPDKESRIQHMKDRRHRICPLCDGYVPVGDYYNHCEDRHANLRWNDHMVAATDSRDMREAQSWAVTKQTSL